MVYSAVEEFAQEFGGHPGGIMAPLRRCPKREDAVERLTDFLTTLIGRAEKRGLTLAPFIGVGCPGGILEDGTVDRGAQNLPGNWEAKRFNHFVVIAGIH